MALRTVVALLLAAGLRAEEAEDPWAHVKAILSGNDVRVTTDHMKPTMFKLNSVREDALIVIRKNTQLAIPRAEIKKIELRMPDALKHTTAGAKTEFPRAPDGRPNKTTTGGITLQTRDGDYLLVYRRADVSPKRLAR